MGPGAIRQQIFIPPQDVIHWFAGLHLSTARWHASQQRGNGALGRLLITADYRPNLRWSAKLHYYDRIMTLQKLKFRVVGPDDGDC